ncbi:MAG TPA: CvpA family protein [Symbiobacteriaceae bacterium]|nr:CvpA family protein [Symbiobacteriaceae bacterium]
MTWLDSWTTLDFIMVAIILAALLVGWAKGLVEVLTGFLVFIIAAFVTGHYSGTVVGLLNRMWNLQESLAGVLERRINLPSEAYKVPASIIPWEKAIEWLDAVPLPQAYKETLAHRLAEWSASAGSQTAAEFIINQLAAGVLGAVVFVIMISVIAWILVLLARLVSDQIKEIPLVGTANRLLGSLVTGAQAALILSLIVGLIGPMLTMYGGEALGGVIQNAELSPHFLALYHWLRQVLFGIPGGPFFVS